MFCGAKLIAVLTSAGAVAACAMAPPSGPTVMAVPSPGKDLATFQQEDGQCRGQSASTVGSLQPGHAATHAAVGGASTGTVAGAAAGSATGAAGGTAIAANNAAAGKHDPQERYNLAYTQCMYARGDTVLNVPTGAYGNYDYASAGYPSYGYPYYDESSYVWGPGFLGGSVFVFGHHHDFDHDFHHGFHDGFHHGFHGGFHGGSHHR